MTFEGLNLNKPLLNALDDLGYTKPTPIQEKSFSTIMSGKDVIGIAQTGTGKTFAYLLPLLRLLTYSKQGDPRVLIVVPTRELVMQAVRDIQDLTKYMTVRVVGAYGGTNIKTQKRQIAEGVDIVVATPGRLVDLAFSRVLRLKSIRKLVIDEVDEMLNLGFRTQLKNLLDLLPPKRQNLLFSATMTDEVEDLIKEFFNFPEKIEAAPVGTPLDQIRQSAYQVPNFNTKVNLLQHLLETDAEMDKVLVFAENKKLADLLHERLEKAFPDQIGVIHSNKSQNYRFGAVEKFEAGTHRVLIATDIIARGLDVLGVSHVVNFNTPELPGNYIHRIGRTGRADREGVAITFVAEREIAFQQAIEALMKMEIPQVPLPPEVNISEELIEAERAGLAGDKHYLPESTLKDSQGAFHDKSDKNKKVNLGGSYRRNLKKKYKKPIKRSGKKR